MMWYFLSIFVDDIGCAVHREHVDEFQKQIVMNCGMNVKIETENELNSVTYMNRA